MSDVFESWDAAAAHVGRQPYDLVSVELDRCSLVYGQGACTADAAVENLLPAGTGTGDWVLPDYLDIISRHGNDTFIIPPNNAEAAEAAHASGGVIVPLGVAGLLEVGETYTWSINVGLIRNIQFYSDPRYLMLGAGAGVYLPGNGLIFPAPGVDAGTFEYGVLEVNAFNVHRLFITATISAAGQTPSMVLLPFINSDSFQSWEAIVDSPQLRRGRMPGVLSAEQQVAANPAIRPCYNTFNTCQDVANYDRGSHKLFFMNRGRVIPEQDALPVIRSIKTTPTRLNPGKGFSSRAVVNLQLQDFPHNDAGVDPYAESVIATDAGTYFGKLLARNLYTRGRQLVHHEGFVGLAEGRARAYVLENISPPDARGRVRVQAKDYLDLANDVKAQCPAPEDVELSADLSIASTVLRFTSAEEAAQVQVVNAFGGEAYVRIGEELIELGNLSGTTWRQCQRGQFGSVAEEHRAGAAVQPAYNVAGVPVWELLQDLLVTFAEVPAAFINAEEWAAEYNLNLANFELTGVVSKPTGVAKLLKELLTLSLSDMWWDELQQQVRWKSQSPFQAAVPGVFNDAEHFLQGRMKLTRKPALQKTRMLTYYGIQNPVDDLTEADNFENAQFDIQAGFESDNAYGQHQLHTVYNRWLRVESKELAQLVSVRTLARFTHIPVELAFSLDAKDAARLVTGDVFDVQTRLLQDTEGAPKVTRFQVLEQAVKKAGSEYAYKALAYFQETGITVTPVGGGDPEDPVDPTDPEAPVISGSHVISGNQTNFNLYVAIGAPPGAIGTLTNPFLVTINAGVVIDATQGNPAFTLGSMPPGSHIKIVNQGSVYGHSGLGGMGGGLSTHRFFISVTQGGGAFCTYSTVGIAPDSGSLGGDAVFIPAGGHSVDIDNTGGLIFGGGSGGSGGAGDISEQIPVVGGEVPQALGSGGGGGQGSDGEASLPGVYEERLDCGLPSNPPQGNPGGAGSVAAPGVGGAAVAGYPETAGLIGETWGIGGSFAVRYNGNSVQVTGTGADNLKGATG